MDNQIIKSTPLPQPDEIRAARECAGLTQKEAGQLIYTSGRRWRAWELGESHMHPAFFELWLIKVKKLVGG